MMLQIVVTNQFRKDYKLAAKRGLKMDLLDHIIRKLANGEELPVKYHDHPLTGDWMQYRECHIQPDRLACTYLHPNRNACGLIRQMSSAGACHSIHKKSEPDSFWEQARISFSCC